MDYAQALDYIHSFINFEKIDSWAYPEALKLDRMRALAKEFGNPQKAYESILIAGSKGKGSIAAISSAILRMENLRVGLYTSPHLSDLRERIQVNGLQISERCLTELVSALKKILESYSWRKSPPTYFEILTVAAFHHFKEMKVQVAVLEAGLGGLYDSTNIVRAKVVGLAPISLEHTDKLGKTISKIAVQKCGIIKGRETVISSPQVQEAEAVILKAVEENDAELVRVGGEIKIMERNFGEDFQRFDIRGAFGNYFDLELRLLGLHQMENAAVAVGLVKGLEKKTRIQISESAVRQGMEDVRWPGRMEVIAVHPAVILDGAQNADSARRLMEAVHRHCHYEKLILVLGISSDKDLDGLLRELVGHASSVIATLSDNPRALPPERIAEKAAQDVKNVRIEKNAHQALEMAVSMAGAGDLILVTGSLYLVGNIRSRLIKEKGAGLLGFSRWG